MGTNNKWTCEDIPCQKGRVVVVTGANSGLGYHTSKALADKGAKVIMACRNKGKGEDAREQILKGNPMVEPGVIELDLADLDSVSSFAERIYDSFKSLDLLINNAGLMAIPYSRTREGFEMQFGVNHIGHFVLTARLWNLLRGTKGSRIVNLSSIAHRFGKIRFEDIHWENGYSKWGAYGMSKLSNLLFTSELARRLKSGNTGVTVASAHPGYSSTELQAKGYLMDGKKLGAKAFYMANRMAAQSAKMGALPTLYAATADDVPQGSFYGPSGFMRLKGWPEPDVPNPKRVTSEVAGRLWELSENLSGLRFQVE